MFKGISFALAACFIWGWIFVVPLFMEGFSPIEVALGRYFMFGIISLFILLKSKLKGLCNYPLSIWLRASVFSLVSTISYYTCVILALRYSTPAICALILGLSPITIAFYGNWRQKECSYKSLIAPSVLILIGLVMINVPHLLASPSPGTYLLGLCCGIFALMSWSWYVVANSKFLKNQPEVKSSDWSTLIGVTTLFSVVIAALILFLFTDFFELSKYTTFNRSFFTFLIGITFLGVVCSWVGSFLWNRATLHLPVSLAGQLTIFETIFGLIFVYAVYQQFPPKMELIGILFLLSAIIYGIRQFARSGATMPLSE